MVYFLQLLRESLEQQRRCEQLTKHEAELRGQLSLYSEKFEEFQKTLTKSNEVFGTYKKEMDKVGLSLPSSLSASYQHTVRLSLLHCYFEACYIKLRPVFEPCRPHPLACRV